jgi:hypothetical protein
MPQTHPGRRHEVREKNGDNKAAAVQEGCDATDSRKHGDVGFALQDTEPAPEWDGVIENGLQSLLEEGQPLGLPPEGACRPSLAPRRWKWMDYSVEKKVINESTRLNLLGNVPRPPMSPVAQSGFGWR